MTARSRTALRVVAGICSGVAAALLVLVVAVAAYAGPSRLVLVDLTSAVSSLLPAGLRGAFVVATPLGGSFRGDFVVAAVVLLVVAHVLRRRLDASA